MTEPANLMSQSRQVLLADWDPIGIRDVPQARDEYDGYAATIVRMLAGGASRQSCPRDDASTWRFDLVGVRLEVEFFEDHIEYSVFTGDESVLDDQKQLFDLIIERGT